MIQRRIPKTTVRFLGIKYDGTNYREILNFCKFAHYQPTSETLVICKRGVAFNVNVDDWVMHIIDDEFIVLNDKEVNAIFKPIGSR